VVRARQIAKPDGVPSLDYCVVENFGARDTSTFVCERKERRLMVTIAKHAACSKSKASFVPFRSRENLVASVDFHSVALLV